MIGVSGLEGNTSFTGSREMEIKNRILHSFSYLVLFRGFPVMCLLIVFLNTWEKEKKERIDRKPGKLVLVCDDWNVENWYSYLDSFEKYDMAMTFYVSHFHTMDSVKKTKLLDLQNRGHEIAYHTLNHVEWK